MKKLMFFALALSITSVLLAAEGFSSLEERMSGKEFEEAGLGKLTSTELNALNEWLRRHSVATLENASAGPAGNAGVSGVDSTKDMRGLPNQPKGSKGDDVIRSTIVGTFDGWNAKGTLFKLANGMIWQQVENDSFSVPAVENPEVIIERGLWNKWQLSMVGHKPKVTVERIQ
jgi:hypothetical protein